MKNMDSTYLFLTLAFSLSVSVAVGCLALLVLTWRTRTTATKGLAAAAEMSKRLIVVEQRLKASAQQVSDQGRRVAWLELKLRHEHGASGQPLEARSDDPQYVSLTERRHRVMVLSRRGMGVDQISEMLSVPQGEVELIISLNSMQSAM